MKKIVRGFGLVIILLLGTLAYFLSGRADVNQNIASSTQEELHNDNDVDYTDPEDEEEVVEEEGEKEWDYSNAIKDQLLKVKAHSLHQRLNISVKIPNTVKKYFQDDQIDLDRFTKQDCSKKLNQLYKQNANQDHSSLSAPAPIAKIIHQSWKNDVLPKKFADWQKTWIDSHPDWEYKLWTDADNDKLCETEFPWFWERYQSFPKNINRADVARYMYMYKYGGVYADLDVVCLQPHDPLVELGGAIVPLMRNLPFPEESWKEEHDIPNAWMASSPGHPFWLYLLHHINNINNEGGTEALSGPIVEYWVLHKFEKENIDPTGIINYMPPGTIFPFDWRIISDATGYCYAPSNEFNATLCNAKFDLTKAYSITYWSHSWGGDGHDHLDN